MVDWVGLDADDTLWQNEEFFRLTQDRFADLLSDYLDPDLLHAKLLAAERKNIGHYGYGIKGFMLSMVETALDVSKDQAPASVIREILTLGQDMLDHPINLLPGVSDTLPKLVEDYSLLLITKGDLLHQEQKLARSGLGDFFDEVYIVSEKDVPTYLGCFRGREMQSAMVGNSMKSDIAPVLAIGGQAIQIPASFEWDLEKAEIADDSPGFHRIKQFDELVTLLPQI